MYFWDWEQLESYIESNFLQISDPGPLVGPIHSFKLSRDKDLNLILETKSQKIVGPEKDPYPPGTVRTNEDTVSLSSPMGGAGLAFGVQPLGTRSTIGLKQPIRETIQTSSLHYFEYHTLQTGPVAYTFEWIANVDHRSYLWPDGVNDKLVSIPSRTFGTASNKIKFRSGATSDGGSKSCIDLNVCGYRTIIGRTKTDEIDAALKPGYLLFFGDPNEDTRKKIRDSLSFFLGFPIVKLGFSKFNTKQELVTFKAIDAYSMDGRAFNTHALPPAPLATHNTRNILDKAELERMANLFCDSYDDYGISSLNWNYWHAVTAPTHMAPAYFGAIIESLQKKYIDAQGSKFNNRVISPADYNSIKRLILEATKNIELPIEDRKTLIEKLHSANTVSQKVRSQRFFEYLDLNMGEAELIAWQRRNNAAHGNDILEEDYISLIRETKLLKLMLHRIVLKITNTNSSYIDYYSLHFPTRPISSGVSD
ncbi:MULTISPECIES: hypothetical protein [unclassified Pseudomonas]|uniref:hypothetical protein n=1 Tax=unclassified Pseudomonas TaxID=196821 RepID=UPI002B22AF73|nr:MULTISPECIES: hypothetical protein [unclassified Pseudomonas]MEA9978746.1 hypothetical protein [Pseudomonas sp. RTS4]MEB0199242.1 hypothetical protein [Pseudomonas sp. 5S4]MEB0247639.1 hypothetical protein [Pseudomonas sp. 10S5]